ncbi:hypothetical protein DFH11DRAFT_1513131, partial [Phellopilus nigrolimitatus]
CTSRQIIDCEHFAFLLFTVLEGIIEGFQEHIHALLAVFKNPFQDPRRADELLTAVRALDVIALYIGAEE